MAELDVTRKRFAGLDLRAPFLDSLKANYHEFPEWFARECDEQVWVLKEDG